MVDLINYCKEHVVLKMRFLLGYNENIVQYRAFNLDYLFIFVPVRRSETADIHC